MSDWRAKLDDLEVDDKLEIDLGDMLVRGYYKTVEKRGNGYNIVLRKTNGKTEYVLTNEIKGLRVL